jgi:replication factor A2
VKQLNEAHEEGDGEFKIDGATFSQVRCCQSMFLNHPRLTPALQVMFIGQIRNISTQATNITYRLDDGTGSIDVKKWIDPDAREALEVGATSTLQQDTYVKVWGKLKQFSNKRHVGATFVRPLSDLNEISHHLLEATLVHLHFSRGPIAATKGGAANNGGGMDTSMGNGAGYGGGSEPFLNGVSANAKKVYRMIKETPQSNEGLHMSDIANRLNMEINACGKAGEELMNSGVIYTTVDDNTWALLNTGF